MRSRPAGPCRVRVVVLDGDGAPADGAVVMITESGGNHSDIAAITDGRGTVELDGLEPGPIVVTAYAEDGRTASGPVEAAGTEPASLTLRFPAT